MAMGSNKFSTFSIFFVESLKICPRVFIISLCDVKDLCGAILMLVLKQEISFT